MPDVLKAPVALGQALGSVVIRYDGKALYEGDLVALSAVERSGFFARIWDSFMLFIQGFLA